MRTEQVELTVLCLIHKDGSYLLQDRVKMIGRAIHFPEGILNRVNLLLRQ